MLRKLRNTNKKKTSIKKKKKILRYGALLEDKRLNHDNNFLRKLGKMNENFGILKKAGNYQKTMRFQLLSHFPPLSQ